MRYRVYLMHVVAPAKKRYCSWNDCAGCLATHATPQESQSLGGRMVVVKIKHLFALRARHFRLAGHKSKIGFCL
jgi:hypothetical protein